MVLILVLLDALFRDAINEIGALIGLNVLILVLLDALFRVENEIILARATVVLILVLLDALFRGFKIYFG